MAVQSQAHRTPGVTPPPSSSAPSDWPHLGSRIRAAREKVGMSRSEIAGRALIGEYTLGQVEAGEADPGRRVVEILDGEFGAEGVLLDAWARVHISQHVQAGARVNQLQTEAFQVRAYAPLVIPDQYQTQAYARALNAMERPMESHYLVTDRPRMAGLMATGSGPPFHCLVLDESVLHRGVGSAEVLAEQLSHLRDLARAAHITVHVIPAGTPNPGLRGAFWTLSFSPRHALAYLPHPRGSGHVVTDAAHIKGYVDLFATLQGAALPAEASLALLERAAEQARPRQALTSGATSASVTLAAPSAASYLAPAHLTPERCSHHVPAPVS